MKWTVLVGLLGAGIGFLVGNLREPEVSSEEKTPVVRSERRAVSREGRLAGARSEGRSEGRSGRNGGQMMGEVFGEGMELTDIARGRLMKWILELEASEFPEVLVKLKDLPDEANADPFSDETSWGNFMKVAMARWYELEGDAVLQWILSKPDVLEKRNYGEYMMDLMVDGYRRDPAASLQRLKKYGKTLVGDLGVKRLPDSLGYAVGRWSQDLAGDLVELEGLEEIFGDIVDESDPFATGSMSHGNSLIRGIVDAGRLAEARVVFEEMDPEMLPLLDAYLEEQTFTTLSAEGWQSLKGAIDRGELDGRNSHAEEVLDGWAIEDPEQAVAWYLDQRFEGVERSNQILTAALSPAFHQERNGLVRNKTHVDGVLAFLHKMEIRGEPVEESYDALLGFLNYVEDWDGLAKLEPRVSSEMWGIAMEKMRDSVVSSGSVDLGGDMAVSLPRLSENASMVLERFGILEKVEAEIQERKVEALREFGRLVEEE